MITDFEVQPCEFMQHDPVYFMFPVISLKIKDNIDLRNAFTPCRKASALLQVAAT